MRKQMMTPDIAQGVNAELQHVVPVDWKIRLDQDGFILTPPMDANASPQSGARILEEVWRIAQFVAYSDFCSISRAPDGAIVVSSNMANGNGFRLLIETI
jgi:hypothetical protein